MAVCNFTLEGGVADAAGSGISNAKVEVYILPSDTLKTFTDRERIFSWLSQQEEPFYAGNTSKEGFFSAVLTRESFQKSREKGISMRESMAVVRAQASGYETAINMVKPEMQRGGIRNSVGIGNNYLVKSI